MTVVTRKRLGQKATPTVQTAPKQNHKMSDLHQCQHHGNSWLLQWSDFGQRHTQELNAQLTMWQGASQHPAARGTVVSLVHLEKMLLKHVHPPADSQVIAPCELGWCIPNPCQRGEGRLGVHKLRWSAIHSTCEHNWCITGKLHFTCILNWSPVPKHPFCTPIYTLAKLTMQDSPKVVSDVPLRQYCNVWFGE